jgi:CSLREA domain-containing protein
MVTPKRGISRWWVRLFGVAALLFSLLIPGFALARNVTFGTVATVDSGITFDSLIHADFNSDGNQDLLIARPDSIDDGGVFWYAGNGNGTFGSLQAIGNALDKPNSVAAYDLDNDGDFDVLARATYDDRLFWFRNDGNGNFSSSITIATGLADGFLAEAADLDNDGDLDVYAGTNQLVIYDNDGNGNFTLDNAYGSYLNAVTVGTAGDVDNDGDLDIIAGSSSDQAVDLYLNSGTGTFAAPVTLATPQFVERVLLADLNRNGSLDLIVATLFTSGDDDLVWYAGNGNGTFGAEQSVPTADTWTLSLDAADIDLDGDLDLVSGNENATSLSWHENLNGLGTSWTERTLNTGVINNLNAITFDYDNDGDFDFAGSSGDDALLYTFQNRNIHRTASLAFGGSISDDFDGIAVGDINNDGINDVVADSANGAVRYYLGNGNGSFGSDNLVYGEPGSAVAVGHLDNDGQLDIAFAEGSNLWGTFNNNGIFDGNQINTSAPASSYIAIQIADLDRDGDGDIAAINTNGDVVVARKNAGLSFTVETVDSGIVDLRDLVLSDLDGDGDLDIVTTATDFLAYLNDRVAWYPNNGGTFGASIEITSASIGPRSVAAGDLDSDGDNDIVIAHLDDGSGSYLSYFLNQGSGTFGLRQAISSSNSVDTRTAELGDIDSDGDLDILSQSISGNRITIEENDGNANFSGLFGLVSGSNVTFPVVVPTDLNRDGRLDLLTYTVWDGADPDFISSVINDGGSATFYSFNTGVTSISNSGIAAVSQVLLISEGLTTDPALEVATLQVRFENGSSAPLNAVQMNNLFAEVRLYSDDDGIGGFSGGDTLLSTVTNFTALNDGYLPFNVNSFDGDLAVQSSADASRTFLVVVEMEADAAAQSPDQFLVTVSSEAGAQISTVEDASNDTQVLVTGQKAGNDVTISITGPTALVVNNIGDDNDASPGDGICETATPGQCTLRAAIEEANNLAGEQTINFNITGAGPHTIIPNSNLPTITEAVIIDGTSEPDYVNAPVVRINGITISEGSSIGLNVLSDGVTIKGLAIGNFNPVGILINGSGFTVQGNYLGTFDGISDNGNSSDGIRVDNATSGIIGGTGANERNIISGNDLTGVGLVNTQNVDVVGNFIGTSADGNGFLANASNGIHITNGGIGNTVRQNVISGNGAYGLLISNGTDNIVQGNIIGLNSTGTAAIANNVYGINLGSSGPVTGNTIGGDITDPTSRNVISGNGEAGIRLEANGNSNTISGNYIGTNSAGNGPINNGLYAIYMINDANNNTIGGDTAAERNLINGSLTLSFARANTISGNYIGTTLTGNTALGDGGIIVLTANSRDNIIGGDTAGERNVISGSIPVNGIAAVSFIGLTNGNRLIGNYIGVGSDGVTQISNDDNPGVSVTAPNNAIGGPNSGEGNVISAQDVGITIGETGDGTLIQGNRIGTIADGTADLPNDGNGIQVLGSITNTADNIQILDNLISGNNNQGISVSFAQNVTIDDNRIGTNANGTASIANNSGVSVGEGSVNIDILNNLISGNTNAGLSISGPNTDDVVVQGNYIGTNAAGTAALANQSYGLVASDVTDLVIGSTGPLPRNVISGNGNNGIFAPGLDGAIIRGNYIGTNAAGTAAIPNSDGILVSASSNLIIGGTGATDRNVISGNIGSGITIIDGSTNTQVQGNYIGLNAAGTGDLGNSVDGIVLNNANNSTIGGANANQRNYIAGNTNSGIYVNGGNSTTNVISNNYIGTNVAGTAAITNGQYGITVIAFVSDLTISNNLVSGNTLSGIRVNGNNTDVTIRGNLIGTNAAGNAALGNDNGIWLIDADNVVVGGSDSAQRNVISGNDQWGILIQGGSNLNVVQGNYIGTNISGTAAVPNDLDGVKIQDAANNLLGGTGDGQGNVISGNSRHGIYLQFDGATGNTIQGNNIGSNAAEDAPLPNAQNGIALDDDAAGNSIGGAATGDAFGEGNLIANNGGDGVYLTATAGSNNSIRGNQIIGNNGLGIDLGVNGVTLNDTNDGDAGTNGLQNFPVLEPIESLTGTVINGTLNSTPGENFTLDFYSTVACDASGYGEAATYLGRVSGGTADSGNGSFSFSLPGQFLAGQYIVGTATPLNGSTSEFSACAPVQTNNLWTSALEFPLNATQTAGQSTGIVNQLLTDTATARWYKFTVTPGSNVQVTVNAPAGSIVTLHKDIQNTYDSLLTPESEAATGASSLPGGYLPGGYLPGGYLPGGYLPGGYLPGGYLPGGYLPGGYLPGGYLPGGYLPEVYAGAQYISLMAVAFDINATQQTITRNTFSLAEPLYVRVAGPPSVTPISVNVTLNEGICGDVELPNANLQIIAGTQPGSDDKQTVILWDSLRMLENYPSLNLTTFTAKLNELAAHPAIDGVVIDLAEKVGTGPDDWKYPRVRFTHEQADRVIGCAEAKSIVAGEITKVVKAYRAANSVNDVTTLKYVTLIGSDDEIPFQRLPDGAGLASEDGYVPPVNPLSAAEASLRNGQIQSQDIYGSRLSIWRGSFDMPIPELAVGRLVKTPSDITGMIDAFIATNGVITPGSALVTGYDFVADGAELVEAEINKGLNLANCATSPNGCISSDRLIQPEREGENGPNAWTANQLRSKLFSRKNDLIFFNGHFYAGGLIAADNKSAVLASEVLAETGVNFTNSVVFALGCHSGFSIPPSGLTSSSPTPDWAEAFARRGTTYVAASGYAYGDTELAEYGERLMINLTKALRTGTGPVAVGTALVDAKIAYLSGKPSLSGLDEKTLLQYVVYGLPQMAINMPGQRILDTGASVIVDVENVSSGPGTSFGLGVGEVAGGSQTVSVDSTLSRVDRTLTDENGGSVTASYLTGSDGVVALPVEPILPLESENVSYAGKVLRGTLFLGGTYNDLPNFIPLTSAATTEGSRGHPAFFTNTFYPSQNWGGNLYANIDGGPTYLQAVMGQYQSNDLSSIQGKLRAYEQMDFKLFYMANNWADDAESRVAAVAPAPQVILVESSRNSDGKVEIAVNLLYNTDVGVQQAVITWTNPNASGLKSWQSVTLVPDANDPTLFTTPAGGVTMPTGAVFMVQAVNGAGLVGVDTNQGEYYLVPPTTPEPPPPPAAPTEIEATLQPTSGRYERDANFAIELNKSNGDPVANRLVSLNIGGLQDISSTNSNGLANFNLQINLEPGEYPARFSFAGEEGLESTVLEFTFTVEKEETSLDLTPASTTVAVGASTNLLAELTAASGNSVDDRTVTFVGVGSAGTFAQTVKTNFDGKAVLGVVPWPAGSYQVTAYFAGNIPLPEGTTTIVDPFYNGSADGPVTLTLTSGVAPTITSTPVTVGVVNTAYSYDVNATGAPAPYYAFVGTPPAGMTINGETGVINWLPTVAGSYPVTVRAANSVDPDATQTFTIVVTSTTTPPQPISPVLENGGCVVRNANGTFTATFGYNNPNTFAVTIPVGNDNKFTPAPQDRGQTTNFLPGRQVAAFTVTFTGGNLVWTLNGKTSTASSSKLCNRPPVAVNDTASVSYRGKVNINVRQNDSDPDKDQITVTTLGTPSKGKVSKNGDGTIRYEHTGTQPLGTTTTDSFTYTISDGKGGTATATVTVTIRRTFGCCLLDNFIRADGSLRSGGKAWTGSINLTSYRIRNNQVETREGGPAYWMGGNYNKEQSACFRVRAIPSNAQTVSLLLKVQGGNTPDWRNGAIRVSYHHHMGFVRVETFEKNNAGPFSGWRRYAPIGAQFAAGDNLSAIAYGDGTVQIFKNGVALGTVDLKGNSLGSTGQATFSGSSYWVDRGGRIGVWHTNASGVLFDSFGGGTPVY